MPHDSLYRSLGPDDATRETNAGMLFDVLQKDGIANGVTFCRDVLGVRTSAPALSRFNVAQKAQRAEDAMLDKLAQRTARTKSISAKIKDTSPLISPETIRALDQLVFEIVAINPDDPRLDRLVNIAKTLTAAADSNANTNLAVDKFQFDAARAVLAKLPELRKIEADTTLDETGRINAARAQLFGEVAA